MVVETEGWRHSYLQSTEVRKYTLDPKYVYRGNYEYVAEG